MTEWCEKNCVEVYRLDKSWDINDPDYKYKEIKSNCSHYYNIGQYGPHAQYCEQGECKLVVMKGEAEEWYPSQVEVEMTGCTLTTEACDRMQEEILSWLPSFYRMECFVESYYRLKM